ncbi:tetratricopeptide repeat protein [Nioella sediminis]|jgi:hypothetical protein|uniref:tetratricopeptide repeat protein n=1 Tax=Nioella sediminis TaxID=1912092 RepID=UPI0008FD2846|nr:tetratricopeptide repeat protein [Nioella sediminis]
MANTDSFIEEVNEELRRDRLFRLFRKWGWIPVLLVIAIVAAAAWREYSLAQERAASEAFGDALIAALDNDDAEARQAALSEITPTSENARVLLAMLLAGEQANGESPEEAAASLRSIAVDTALPERYRDLALLKAHMLAPQDFATAMAELDQLARPGRPYRPLAMEQQALLHVSNGDREAAIALLRLLEEDSEATPGLQQRASQLIVALESGAALQDPAPVEDTATDGSETATEDEAGAEAPADEGEEPPAAESAPEQ